MQEIIAAHFREAFIRRIGERAQQALLYEALTTPKPGLVDCLSIGAQGEVASGFRTVQEISLPALREALRAGKSLQEAGLTALIHLMAHVQDSNIIHRAGMESQHWVTSPAQLLLDTGWDDEFLRRPDGEFIARTISPGGSADLLAATYILHLMTTKGATFTESSQGPLQLFSEQGVRILPLPRGHRGRGLQLPVLLLPAVRAGQKVRRQLRIHRIRVQGLLGLPLPPQA